MLSERIAVCAVNEQAIERAKHIATTLNLPFVTADQFHPLLLMIDTHTAFLRRNTAPFMDWHIDFSSREYTIRRSHRTRKNDALSKAIGLHKNAHLNILDMSAGLGKDAHWLAYCGASVTLLERDPVLAFLLKEAIDALDDDPIRQRMTVIHTDAETYLDTIQPGQFDVTYYDPMFLPRQKSALVKKDMQIMHLLLGEDKTSDILLKVLDKIPKMVVKRAKSDPAYDAMPHNDLNAGLVRYEVFSRSTKPS